MWQAISEHLSWAADSIVGYVKHVLEYGWRVPLELLLIGMVIYAVLTFLQGTRGLRLARGLVLILVTLFLVVTVVAKRFQLDRINVLAAPALYAVFFGSLVVFQPELRRALMQLGEAQWLQRLMRETESVIAPIVSAARHFSGKKIGAIVAIERHVGLGSIAEGGVQLDSVLSMEVLRAVFSPASPLHDLGVVVRKGRIAAAACQFPLTESDSLDPTLGSRHRAAVGLTEDCDAVVVVVSEETGTISLAVEGRLRRGLTPETLERELRELLDVAGDAKT